MEQIGKQQIWSYFDEQPNGRAATNLAIRRSRGHSVQTYFELAMKVAELQFRNREHVLLFRGQAGDYRSIRGHSLLKATLFRLEGNKKPTPAILTNRFEVLRFAEEALTTRYATAGFSGIQRLRRHRILRWAILQHYDVCRTPLLDVTQSLRIAASFASGGRKTGEAYVYVLGVPNISGAVTASSEANLQIVRLSSACPPEAVRPHVQEGYLLGEYPEIVDYDQHRQYRYHEMDFGRRLIAKFRLNLTRFWHSENFLPAPAGALYPKERRDLLLPIIEGVKRSITPVQT